MDELILWKYPIFIILLVNITRVSAAYPYITDFKCRFGAITFICSDEANEDISATIQSSVCSSNNSSKLAVNFLHCELFKLPNQLSNNSAVWSLDASHISLDALTGDEFNGVDSATTINLSSNRLRRINQPVFSSQKELETLDLSSNEIQSLSADAFNGLTRLSTLYLRSNNLTEITSGTFIGLSNLDTLDLSHNRLQRLNADTFLGLIKLGSLDLQWNNISALPSQSFNSLHSLHSLDLSFNNIIELEAGYFVHLKSLRHLNASHSQLAEIKMGAMSPLRQLTTLDLSNNRLMALDFNQFLPSFQRMQSLRLDGNRLTELDGRFAVLYPELTSLSVTNNLLNCTYLGEFISSLQHLIRTIDTALTAYGPNIAGVTCVASRIKHNDNEQTTSKSKESNTMNPLEYNKNSTETHTEEEGCVARGAFMGLRKAVLIWAVEFSIFAVMGIIGFFLTSYRFKTMNDQIQALSSEVKLAKKNIGL